MDMQALKEKIDKLDPQAHKALRDVLTAECDRLAKDMGEPKPQAEEVSDPFAAMFKKAVDLRCDLFESHGRYTFGFDDQIQCS